MFQKHFVIIAIVLLAYTLLAGCSGNGTANPVIPPDSNEKTSNSHQLLGLYQFVIDSDTESVDIIPLRTADMHLNALPFLEPPPLLHLTLESLAFDGDIIDTDIGLRHPFLGLTEFSGFDVCGILISNGSYTGYDDVGIRIAGPGDLYLINADGHSRWWNPAEFPVNDGSMFAYNDGLLGTPDSYADYNSTLNGYKYFTEGLDPDDPVTGIDPANRGLFEAGQKNIRHYTIDIGQAGLIFNYAIDASWAFPGGDYPWVAPDDFPPEANRVEPYLIDVIETSNTLWYSGSGNGGGLSLDINIYDWYNLDQDWVSVESPGAFTAVDLTTPTGGTEQFSTFHVDLAEVTLDSNDDLMIVITAYCEDIGFQGFIPGVTTAAYKVKYADVGEEPSEQPVAIAKTCDCLYIPPGGSIEFDGTDSYSPSGSIVNWEWDFNGDSNFNDGYAGPPEKPVATFPDIGDYLVNLRVTDNLSHTDTLAPSEQLHVFVDNYSSPPTAVAEVVPTIGFISFEGDFTGSNSTGNINLYEWDFEGDCIWDYEHLTIGDTTHAYTEENDYTAILRVTGDGCSTDEVPVRMIDPLGIITNGNFWDGEFDPWTHGHWNQPQLCLEEIIYSPIFKNIVRFYSGPTYDGSCTWIIQYPDEDVTSYTSLYFNFFFYIDFNTLNGDGWMGGEPDIMLQVQYEDALGTGIKEAWYAYDTTYDSHWEWDSNVPPYVVYHHQEVVPSDTWCERKTIDLMTLDPLPDRITMVRISARGWSWNEYIGLCWFSTE